MNLLELLASTNINDEKYEFVDPAINDAFTLGSFPYTIANGTHTSDRIYPSEIDYCRDVLFSHDCEIYREDPEEYKSEIMNWLQKYISEIEIIRPLRNQSSHPNSILGDVDAVFCQDYTIRVQRLIDKLIRICVE